MNADQINRIRHDLNLILRVDDYELEWKSGHPLRLVLSEWVRPNVRRFSAEIVRLHDVEFEIVNRRAPPRPSARRGK